MCTVVPIIFCMYGIFASKGSWPFLEKERNNPTRNTDSGVKPREVNPQMGRGSRRLVAAPYTLPPWRPIEVNIDQKWKRALVLKQADHRGLCLIRVIGMPTADPIMLPLSAIRLPSQMRLAKRRLETATQIQVKKPRIEGSNDGESDDE